MREITIDDILYSLPKRLKKDKVGSYETVFHFDFTDVNKQFTVEIKSAVCTVETGFVGTPKCTVKSKAETYIDLTTGKGNPQMAIMMGKVKVSNIPEIMSFAPLFGKFDPEDTNTEENKTLKGIEARTPQNGPLKGLRVLDLTRLLPGPLGTMLMADMGAEVIKIEAPEFLDYTRDFPPFINGEPAGYLAFNRSKKSLALDYSKPEGREVLLELVKTADIFIEQFRPGVMQKMGLGYEDVKAINPKIIYVSVTGYGQTGPYAQLAGHDLNYISYAGILSGNQHVAPQMPNVQIADIAGGSYMAVIACLSAIYAREKTGIGQYVDVAMMDGVMPLAINSFSWFFATQKPEPRDEGYLSGGLLNYGIYPVKEGKYIALGTLEAKFWNKFCEVIQKPDWKNRMLPSGKENLALYKEELTAVFMTENQKYWTDMGLEHDLLINPIYEIDEIEQNPQVQARQMIIEMEHPTAGKIKSLGVPLKFSETKASPAWTPPVLGEDTLSILKEAGISDDKIQELAKNKIIQGI